MIPSEAIEPILIDLLSFGGTIQKWPISSLMLLRFGVSLTKRNGPFVFYEG